MYVPLRTMSHISGRQVREKDDRHQQKKLDGFLRPRAELDAATSASAAPDVDMEVRLT